MKTDTRLVGGIDMGTTKVSALIGERYGGSIRVIGIGTTPSDGLKQGVIVDIERASRSVERAVRDAEKMAGLTLREYSVGVAGEHIRSMNSRGVVSIPGSDGEISRDDVERSLAAARNFELPADREIIHTLPQQYIVDDQDGILEPSGMFGARLEARVHVVTASRHALDNVVKALDNSHVEVGELVLEPLASSCSVLRPEEKDIGVMLIDIGGGTSDVLIYGAKGIIASGVIGIGGNNITGDIAYGLRTSIRSAEEIKVRCGCALSCMVGAGEKCEVQDVGMKEVKHIARHILSGIIEPRVSELFSLINDQITKNKYKTLLGAGVVLTGGSSVLEGTRELAEQVFDLPVRIGVPLAVDGLTEVVSHPMHATGVGLLLFDGLAGDKGNARNQMDNWWRQSFEQLRRAIASFI